MQNNKTKAKLKAGETVIGSYLRHPDPGLAEVLGHYGWDYLLFDAEHCPLTERDCEHLARVSELRDVTPIVRVPVNQPSVIGRFLDTGKILSPRSARRLDRRALERPQADRANHDLLGLGGHADGISRPGFRLDRGEEAILRPPLFARRGRGGFFPRSMSVTARTTVAALPYLFGLAGIVLNGISSARTGEKRWHTAGPMLLNGVALGLAVLAGDRLVLAILFLCVAGFASQSYMPVFWTLPTAFWGKSAAAVSIGTINSLGNLGGFAGPYIFGYLKTATGRFDAGLWYLAGCMILAGILASLIRIPRKP